jgi:cell fate regulator YaaT (PSP1 superfamily)
VIEAPREREPDHEDDGGDAPATPSEPWGQDDGSPAPSVTLAPDLPSDAPSADPDPASWPLANAAGSQLGEDVATVIGVRFVRAGRVQWLDAGDGDYAVGERVIVEAERGTRPAWIATPSQRRAVRDRSLRRVVRRAEARDRQDDDDTRTGEALRAAKDVAAALRLPIKVFRVELGSGKALVYYTSDERVDVRDFVRDVSAHPMLRGSRIELRQLGARDEAKMVGGIGSCGLTLCCTTWLPEFVPVSIKMAKDQGLVLAPTKVAGQCGRLKCCLVYEQATYAEMRKGLPKLGKRVITARGEGRVVEVDVLRQRLRVAYAPGEQEVLPANEVRPMFPSGGGAPQPHDSDPSLDESDEPNEPDDTPPS